MTPTSQGKPSPRSRAPHRNLTGAATAAPVFDNGPARLALSDPDDEARAAIKPLGVSPYRPGVLYGLSVQDARHHVHVLGPTGVGKSTLLVNLALAEAEAGRGLVVFDPKGDLTRDLLDRLPASVADRLVLIDPDEDQAPAALNLFDLGGGDPDATADALVGVMAKVWSQYWGPRTDDIARHAVLTLAHTPGATLADLPILLADTKSRRRTMTAVRQRLGPVRAAGLDQFWRSYDDLPEGQRGTLTGPLLSRLRAVLSRPFAAGLLGTTTSTFDLSNVLDGGILLVRLPKQLGENTVRLVGSLLLAALLRAAAQRSRQPEHERTDATLLVDECQNFLNLPVGLDDALAEARGLHLSLVLSHQNLGQLSTPIGEAVKANARNKVYFTLAPHDARELRDHVAPYFEPEDLMWREAYGIVVRLVIDGRDGEAFSLDTLPQPPPQHGRAEHLRAAARRRGLPTAVREKLAGHRHATTSCREPHAPTPTRPYDPTAHLTRRAARRGRSVGGSIGASLTGSAGDEAMTEPPTPPDPTAQAAGLRPPEDER